MAFVSRSQSAKFSLSVLLVAVAFAVLLFEGRTSPFAPGQIQVSLQTAESGLPPQAEATKGFHVFNTILFIITGFGAYEALFTPILIVPITAALFALCYRISDSYMLSALLVAGFLLSGSDGLDKLYIGIHGLGTVILFSVCLLAITQFRRGESQNDPIYALFIGMISLAFISYNRSGQSLLFIGFIAGLLYITKQMKGFDQPFKSALGRKHNTAGILLLVTIIAHLYLHGFVMQVFVPYFADKLGNNITSIDLFLLKYFSQDTGDVILSDLIVSSPQSLVYIGIVKYLLILIVLVLYTSVIAYNLYHRREFLSTELVVISFTSTMAAFAFVRTFIGNNPVGYAYIPALLAAAGLYKIESDNIRVSVKKKIKVLCLFVAIGLLITSASFAWISVSSSPSTYDKPHYFASKPTAEWHQSYATTPIESDELTRNLIELHTFRNNPVDGRRMEPQDVLFLLNRGGESSERIYLINYKLDKVTIGGWNSIVSWEKSSEKINSNPQTNRVYNSGWYSSYKAND